MWKFVFIFALANIALAHREGAVNERRLGRRLRGQMKLVNEFLESVIIRRGQVTVNSEEMSDTLYEMHIRHPQGGNAPAIEKALYVGGLLEEMLERTETVIKSVRGNIGELLADRSHQSWEEAKDELDFMMRMLRSTVKKREKIHGDYAKHGHREPEQRWKIPTQFVEIEFDGNGFYR